MLEDVPGFGSMPVGGLSACSQRKHAAVQQSAGNLSSSKLLFPLLRTVLHIIHHVVSFVKRIESQQIT